MSTSPRAWPLAFYATLLAAALVIAGLMILSAAYGAWQGPFIQSARLLSVMTVGACAFALLGSIAAARRILVAYRILAADALALGDGAPVTRRYTGVREIDAIGTILADASHRLDEQSAALAISNRELAARVEARTSELADQSAVLTGTLDSMDQGLVMIRADGVIGVVNQRAANLLGFDPAFIAGGPRVQQMLDQEAALSIVDDAALRDWLVGAHFKLATHQVARSDGTVLEIRSTCLPNGGLVRTYADITARKAAETALMEQTALLDVTLESMDQGLVMVDQGGRVRVCNERALNLLGLSDDVRSSSLRPTEVADYRAGQGEFTRVDTWFSGQVVAEAGFQETVRPNGAVLEIRTVYLPGGGAVRTLTDVTERKRAEAAVLAAETEYRILFENAVAGIYRSTPDGRQLRCNPALARLNGYETPEDLLAGVNDIASEWYVEPGRRDEFKRLMAKEGRITDFVSEIYRQGTRERIWVSETAWAIRDAAGEIMAYEGTVLDATERMRAEAALAESEARYRLLAEASNDVITRMDLNFVRDYVSPACRRLLGYEPEELIGAKPISIMHVDDSREVYRITKRLIDGHAERDVVVFRARHKAGHWIWVEAGLTILRDEATGKPESLLTTLRDVTERKTVALALAEANHQAETAKSAAEAVSQAKTDFLAAMSHEIRTPLNGVIGYADLLLNDDRLTTMQRLHAERIQSCGEALLTIVDDVLDFSKIEAGRLDLDPQPFALQVLLDSTLSIVRPAAEQKRLDLRLILDSDLPSHLVGDPDRLRQILLNLLNNAIKFTLNGSVTLNIAAEHGGTEMACRLRCAVTDTGIGIAKGKSSRLFERFSQVDGSIRRDFGGTGLGLAISRRLVGLMGGKIGVDSQEGVGSTFWFLVELPLTKPPDQRNTASGVVSAAVNGARILVVDDVQINQDLARAVLESAGYEIDTAADGTEAIMAVQSHHYDLVLMDIQMPCMDGITATQHIRELGTPESCVPIVAMTANVLPAQVAHLRAAGMTDHIGKPFRAPDLLAKVAHWTRGERLERAAAVPPGHPGSADDVRPALDEAVLADVQALLGPEAVRSLLARLADDLGGRLGPGPTCPVEIARHAHALASPAGLLGFRHFADLCQEVERALVAGDQAGAPLAAMHAARHAVLREIAGRAA